MDLNKIRDTFNEGSVAVSDGSLSILYAQDGFFCPLQSFSNDRNLSKQTFESLLKTTEQFEIHNIKRGKMKLSFILNKEQEPQVEMCFLPLKRGITKEEIEKVKNELREQNREQWNEFGRLITKYDLDDEDGLSEAASEILKLLADDSGDEGSSRDIRSSWDALVESANYFYETNKLGELEVVEPSRSCTGYLEFSIESVKHHSCTSLSGKDKLMFLNMCEKASEIVFEVVSNDGDPATYINIILFA